MYIGESKTLKDWPVGDKELKITLRSTVIEVIGLFYRTSHQDFGIMVYLRAEQAELLV